MSFEGRGRGRSRGRWRAGRGSWRGPGQRGAAGLGPGPGQFRSGVNRVDDQPAPAQPRGSGVPDFSTDIDTDFNSHSQTGGYHGSGGQGPTVESGSAVDKPDEPGPSEGLVPSTWRVHEQVKQISFSSEELLAMNKEVIHVLPEVAGSQERYTCTVCRSVLSDNTIKTHLTLAEHVKKLKLVSVVDKTDPLWCSYCCTLLSNEVVHSHHMAGKKHKQHIAIVDRFNRMLTKPIGNKLDSIVVDQFRVVKEGNGQTLGLTSTMRNFSADVGPYIGLKYAQETGGEGIYPDYTCTLCQVHSDPGNRLHFTSATHRMNVLQKDYPAKAKEVMELTAGKKRGELHSKLREVAAEIEATEGRRVELIQRCILAGGGLRKTNSTWRGRGRASALTSPGSSRGGRGKQRGGAPMFDRGGSYKKPWVPYGQHSTSGPIHVPGRGGYGSQNQQQQWAGGSGETRTPYGRGGYGHTYQQHQEFGGGSYGRGGGRGEFGRYHPYARGGRGMAGWGVGRGGGLGREGYEKGKRGGGGGRGGGWGYGGEMSGSSGDGFGYGGTEPAWFGGSGCVDGFGGQQQDWSADMPQQHAKIGGEMNSQLQTSIRKLKSEPGDKTEALKALATTMINSEEDAENAFQLSSALTQALLDFRMKSLDSMIPENPLTSLLKVLQKQPAQDK